MTTIQNPWPAPSRDATFIEKAKELLGPSAAAAEERYFDERRKLVSPEGKLQLLPFPDLELLEKRRLEYSIIDQAFYAMPAFDRVWIRQLPHATGGTFVAGGRVIMTDETREYADHRMTRGLLLGAGLLAQSRLNSNGIFLGHIVRYASSIVRKMDLAVIMGKPFEVLVMTDGEISGSEDTAAMLRDGRLRIEEDEDGMKRFVLSGKSLGTPEAPAEYSEFQ